MTGEANYQGAAAADGRKTFYDGFPFDARGTTYVTGGNRNVTNDTSSADTTYGDILVRLLPRDVWYFIAGRDAGMIPFFFPGLAITLLWLIRWRRMQVWQVAAFLGAAVSILAFFVITPYSWNGGGGPPGNRYFLSTYPVLLFLLPPGTWTLAGVLSAAVGLAFTGSMLASPVSASQQPWLTVGRKPFTWLPVEITLANNLPVSLLPGERARIQFLTDPYVLFYYLDQNTYFVEGDGLWIAGDAATDILIRTDWPIVKVTMTVSGKYVPNDFTATLQGETQRVHLDPGGRATLVFTPAPGVWHAGSYGVVLHMTTTRGFVPAKVEPQPAGRPPDTRNLGVFVEPKFVVAPAGK